MDVDKLFGYIIIGYVLQSYGAAIILVYIFLNFKPIFL